VKLCIYTVPRGGGGVLLQRHYLNSLSLSLSLYLRKKNVGLFRIAAQFDFLMREFSFYYTLRNLISGDSIKMFRYTLVMPEGKQIKANYPAF
jgi:hypothetical protein